MESSLGRSLEASLILYRFAWWIERVRLNHGEERAKIENDLRSTVTCTSQEQPTDYI
jgi:hypothetical protein